jgi:hypothetical protein
MLSMSVLPDIIDVYIPWARLPDSECDRPGTGVEILDGCPDGSLLLRAIVFVGFVVCSVGLVFLAKYIVCRIILANERSRGIDSEKEETFAWEYVDQIRYAASCCPRRRTV